MGRLSDMSDVELRRAVRATVRSFGATSMPARMLTREMDRRRTAERRRARAEQQQQAHGVGAAGRGERGGGR